ncbi:hypothetical protein V6Z11_D08G082700 [Gossypium hirsutum]
MAEKGENPLFGLLDPLCPNLGSNLQNINNKPQRNRETFRFPATDPRGWLPRSSHGVTDLHEGEDPRRSSSRGGHGCGAVNP